MGRGVLKKKLLDYINLNNLKNNVTFINFKKNPYPYIKMADLFILSSKFEGLPNVLLEAIVLKKFIISSNCPTGPREILLNGKAGYLFSVSDYKQLSQKILLFSKNSKKINDSFISKAYNGLKRFDYDNNLNNYFNLVKSIM